MRKSIIIIGLIVAAYLFFAIVGVDYFDSLFHKNIYVENISWEYSKGKWIEKTIENNLDLKKYTIYKPNTFEYIGKYDLKYKDTWYIKEKKKFEQYGYSLIAFKGKGIKLYPFDVKYGIDKSVANKILKKININKYGQLNIAKTIKLDVDNDHEEEIIYVMSNLYSDMEESKTFSVIALYDNEKYSIIKYVTDTEDQILNLYAAIDIDGDKNLEFIVASEFYSCVNSYSMYGLIDGEYVKLVGTE